MRNICILISIWGLNQMAFSQNVFDAARINSNEHIGTARTIGMGGAFHGLGVDPSSTYYNPANAANFNQSYISFSPYLGVAVSSGENFGFVNTKSNFSLGNLSLLFKTGGTESTGAVFFNIQREADYHSFITDDYNGSLINHWTNNANNIGANNSSDIYNALPFSSALAYDTYILDFDSTNQVYHAITSEHAGQERITESNGNKHTISLGFGNKVSDEFKYGFSLDIPIYEFHRTISYNENGSNSLNDFQSFSLKEKNNSRGSGLNLKAGVSSKLGRLLRISASYKSPGVMWISDQWTSTVNSNFSSKSYESSANGNYDYYYISPQQVDLGLGLVVSKSLALDIDYTLIDNSASRFVSKHSSFDLANVNTSISNELAFSHNIRAGAEARINNQYLRAGAGYQSNVFTDEKGNGERITYGFGIGTNKKSYRFDIGLSNMMRYENLFDFAPENENYETRKINEFKVMGTWTFKF